MTHSLEAFTKGDRAIRRRLTELAAEREPSCESIVRRPRHQGRGDSHLEVHVYELLGTRRCISLRATDVCLAAEPDKMARYIEPRLQAMFEDLWWRKSLVLMARERRS